MSASAGATMRALHNAAAQLMSLLPFISLPPGFQAGIPDNARRIERLLAQVQVEPSEVGAATVDVARLHRAFLEFLNAVLRENMTLEQAQSRLASLQSDWLSTPARTLGARAKSPPTAPRVTPTGTRRGAAPSSPTSAPSGGGIQEKEGPASPRVAALFKLQWALIALVIVCKMGGGAGPTQKARVIGDITEAFRAAHRI